MTADVPPGYMQQELVNNQKQPTNGQPPQGYSQPQQSYGQQQTGYGQPQPGYGQPTPGYGQPQPGYGQPTPGYGRPPPYNQPPPNEMPGYGPQQHQQLNQGAGWGNQAGSQMGNSAPQADDRQWLTRPEAIPGIPPGLEYFATLDTIHVSQKMNMIEMMSGGWVHQPNEYVIMNSDNMKMFDAKEEVDEWMLPYGNRRGFEMHIYDNTGYEVMKLHKDMANMCAGCHCCAEKEQYKMDINIEAPPGQPIGRARQLNSYCEAKFAVEDNNGEVMLTIVGGGCQCGGDTGFQVMSADGTQHVGSIVRKMKMIRMSNADNFSISFPMDMDVKAKACMLGALILIDFRYFQAAVQSRNNRRRRY